MLNRFERHHLGNCYAVHCVSISMSMLRSLIHLFVKSLMPDDAIKHWQASCHHKRKACHFLNYSLWLPGYSVVPRMIDTHCAQGASHHYLPERNSCKIELAAMLIPAPCQKKSSDLALGGKLWDVHSAFPKHGPKNHAKHGCVQLRLQPLGSP